MPEFALVEAVWEAPRFEAARWIAALAESGTQLKRLPELQARYVVGTRPADIDGRPYNEGYLWSAGRGLSPLRRKFFLPDEPGSWEARWFDRGDPDFPAFHAGDLTFGLNICTELWALETYGAYAAQGVQVVLSPRATGATTRSKWLAVGVVAAARSGAFSLSSNRVDLAGTCGGVGWIISPEGEVLALTSSDAPFATRDIDLAAATTAKAGYPCYAFSVGPRVRTSPAPGARAG